MRVRFSDRFFSSYLAAPPDIQRAFDRRLTFLLRDIRHPSLHAKKYDKARGIWQARITRNWRFYFTIEADTYCIHDMIPHPK